MKISQRIAHSRPLATTAMHGRVESMRHAGQDVIDFSIAISHFPAPAAVLDAVGAALEGERTMPYTSVVGAHAVRERLCAKLERENGGPPMPTRSSSPTAPSRPCTRPCTR